MYNSSIAGLQDRPGLDHFFGSVFVQRLALQNPSPNLLLLQIINLEDQDYPPLPTTMTSMSAESVATILVSCKQTRFHIDNPNYREVSSHFPRDTTLER